jgi:hypothetical protein
LLGVADGDALDVEVTPTDKAGYPVENPRFVLY